MSSVAAPHGYPVVSMSVSSGTHEDSSALLLLTIDNVYSLVAILTCEGMSKHRRARKKIHLKTSMDFMSMFGQRLCLWNSSLYFKQFAMKSIFFATVGWNLVIVLSSDKLDACPMPQREKENYFKSLTLLSKPWRAC